MKIPLFRIFHHLALAGLLIFSLEAFANWPVKYIPDPPEAPSEEEVNTMEAQAQAGDWKLKRQFATAYFYGNLMQQYWGDGCKKLANGHLCRMMALRAESGKQFLDEILEVEVKNGQDPITSSFQSQFREDYAQYLLIQAHPEYKEDDPACKAAVRYLELIMDDKDVIRTARGCVVDKLLSMAYWGHCMPKVGEKKEKYIKAIKEIKMPCPRT